MEQDKYEIGADLIAAVLAAVDGKNQPALLALLEPMHSADIADLIEQIDAGQRLGFFTLWGATIDAKVFVELEDSISVELLQALPSDLIADGLNQLQTDDLVYLTEEMPESDQDRILASLTKTRGYPRHPRCLAISGRHGWAFNAARAGESPAKLECWRCD